MATTKQFVHFTVGEDAGIMLMNIAQEHLLYKHNPKKAISAITQSLVGVPMDMALSILKGDTILTVDVDSQEFLAGQYDPALHSTIFPRIDCLAYTKRVTADIFKQGERFRDIIGDYARSTRNGRVQIDANLTSLIEAINGNDKILIEEILADDSVSELESLLRLIKAYIENSYAKLEVVQFMKQTWPEEFDALFSSIDDDDDAHEMLKNVIFDFNNFLKQDLSVFTQESDKVAEYIQEAAEINQIIAKGIEPVNIMDNYSAGWLSPKGVYYALNGDIAQMLHNQIAQALYDEGLIPQTEDNEGNPDNWLLGEGWVKVHGDMILFEGNLNEVSGRGLNRYMTNKQIDILTEYCRRHHRGIIRCTFQPLSALQFQRIARVGKKEFYRKYFMGELAD